jgi:hypothetical protein
MDPTISTGRAVATAESGIQEESNYNSHGCRRRKNHLHDIVELQEMPTKIISDYHMKIKQ